MAAARSSQCRVLPSMSVKSSVTVPVGRGNAAAVTSRWCTSTRLATRRARRPHVRFACATPPPALPSRYIFFLLVEAVVFFLRVAGDFFAEAAAFLILAAGAASATAFLLVRFGLGTGAGSAAIEALSNLAGCDDAGLERRRRAGLVLRGSSWATLRLGGGAFTAGGAAVRWRAMAREGSGG